MKDGIIDRIKGEVNQLVDNRNSELEDRKRTERSLAVFNLPEHNQTNGKEIKEANEFDIFMRMQ